MNCPRCGGPGRLAGVFANGELHGCAACGVVFSAGGAAFGASELELVPAAAAERDEAGYIRRLGNSGAPIWMIADIVGRGVGFVRRSLRGDAFGDGP